MIIETIKQTLKSNPYLLFPYGRIEKKVLNTELKKYNFKFPKELIQFWIEFGGGDLFENETILSPIPSSNEYVYDIKMINSFRYQKGLSTKYFVFEENGSEMTAFDKETKEIFIMSKSENKIEKKFANINLWFEYFWRVNQ